MKLSLASVLLSLMMGLTVGCGSKKGGGPVDKSSDAPGIAGTNNRGNKNIDEMNVILRELAQMGIDVSDIRKSRVSSLNSTQLKTAETKLDRFITLGDDTVHLATSKNVPYAGLDLLKQWLENAKVLKNKVADQIKTTRP